MMPEQGFKDFIDRAIINYEVIEKHARPDGPYEVTQLIASFLLVAGWPGEKGILPPSMNKMSLEDAEKRGFPVITVLSDSTDYHPTTLVQMMTMLRNAVAHANIQFFGRHDEIREIALSDKRWNRKAKRNEFRTTVRIPVSTLRDSLYALQSIAHDEYLAALKPPA